MSESPKPPDSPAPQPPPSAVAPVQAGEPRATALPRLVEQEGGRLFALGRRFCGNEEEARELVQETFLQAWRAWDRFEGRSTPASWLWSIAARACQRMHRPRAGAPDEIVSLEPEALFAAPLLGYAPDDATPLGAAQRREARERLEAAIAALPLEFRLPLVLREIVGLEPGEVAALLGLEPATVRTRVHRARLKLRAALEEVLPRRAVAPPAYEKQLCLDLLRAKQEALDRGVPFELPRGMVCERCKTVFASLDFGQSLCRELGEGELPPPLREWLARELREAPPPG
ncbi:MAG: sigma-70 family RNA polymerase sigma factor [Planctomycetes bacterium]|nr:sigma-70 family RNA polymerase sigma factor [Planctomycetota bacterium]